MATSAIDVTTTQVANTSRTPTGPLGVEMIGAAANTTAGYTVTDVGNVTGSGFDSFVVSAPSLITTPVGSSPLFSTSPSAAYLVFGSKDVNFTTVSSFLNLAPGLPNTPVGSPLTSGQRAGDLAQLGGLGAGNLGQINPTVLQPTNGTTTFGFNFDGVKLITGNRASGLGLSVAALGDLNGDGIDDFAIGAPNDTGGGTAFVVYGGTPLANLAVGNKTIDLEPTAGTVSGTTPTKVVGFSIPNSTAGTNVGFAVGGLGNYFNPTSSGRDVGIGVPGLNGNTGAAFAVSGAYINSVAAGTNVNLNSIVVNNSLGGIEYTGVTAGDLVGSSISTAGNFDGATSTTGQIANAPTDLLIGAPGANGGGGAVYLVYSLQTTTANATLGTIQSLSTLGVAPTTNPVTTPLEGVVYNDVIPGDRFGFSVATAGDFNSDGADDIIVGAPGSALTNGGVVLIYGLTGTAASTTNPRINGIFTTSTAAPPARGASFVGESVGSFAGFSVAPSRHIAFGTSSGTVPSVDFLIGSPGLSSGAAYLIPGNTSLTGVNQLSAVLSAPIGGQKFTAVGGSDVAIQVIKGFGTSVSALNPVTNNRNPTTTLDTDAVADIFIGAPFTNFVSPNATVPSRPLAGVAYALEGSLLGGTSTVTPPTTGTGTGTATFAPLAASLLQPSLFTGDLAGQAFPPVSSLEHLSSYAPLPVTIAYQQFLPAPGFLAREEVYHHPSRKSQAHQAPRGTILNVSAIGHSENQYAKVNTIPKKVFTRGRFRQGQTITFTHKVKVIPTSQQTERLTSA